MALFRGQIGQQFQNDPRTLLGRNIGLPQQRPGAFGTAARGVLGGSQIRFPGQLARNIGVQQPPLQSAFPVPAINQSSQQGNLFQQRFGLDQSILSQIERATQGPLERTQPFSGEGIGGQTFDQGQQFFGGSQMPSGNLLGLQGLGDLGPLDRRRGFSPFDGAEQRNAGFVRQFQEALANGGFDLSGARSFQGNIGTGRISF